MDFKFCLLAPCSESPSLAMQKFRDDVIAHAHCRNQQFLVTKNRTQLNKKAIMAPWESPFTSNFQTARTPQILDISVRIFLYK